MAFLEWAALIVGPGLIASGVHAIRRQKVRVPEEYTGTRAVRLGWLWIALGALFVLAVIFDIALIENLVPPFPPVRQLITVSR